MVDANKLTLQFYRQACRLLPAILNRQGHDAYLDYHKSKLNLGKWVRKGANMRNPKEVTETIRIYYDCLFSMAYMEVENGIYSRYLMEQPTRYEGGKFTTVDKSRGLNLIDYNKFKNKSNFLRKFVKGVRPLLH